MHRESSTYTISIHALREEGDMMAVICACAALNFYPRPPRGGRPSSSRWRATSRHFYPRPPRGGRRQKCAEVNRSIGFLSTPSARRATGARSQCVRHDRISIHALREEGDHRKTPKGSHRKEISIHALREEGDVRAAHDGGLPQGISIHALREEGDAGYCR